MREYIFFPRHSDEIERFTNLYPAYKQESLDLVSGGTDWKYYPVLEIADCWQNLLRLPRGEK